MRSKLLVLAITLFLLLSGMLIAVGGRAREGEQSIERDIEENDISKIYDWYDLDDVRDNLDDSYILMNDLDENTDGYDDLVDTEKGWDPIGEFDEDDPIRFSGRLYGDCYEIRDLYINRPEQSHVGLFEISEGDIVNLSIVNANVSGNWYVGSLAGTLTYGTIHNSSATGDVSGASVIGGLVGTNTCGLVNNSYSLVDVNGEENVGGLIGYLDGTVMGSYAKGNVQGAQMVGGLAGFNNGTVRSSYTSVEIRADPVYFPASAFAGGLTGINQGEIYRSYSMSNVITTESGAGGLVGYNYGLVSNSYARGDVEGDGYEVTKIGGLVGWNNQGVVENSYSTGIVNGTDYVGGLVGRSNDSMVKNSFWDRDRSGIDSSDGGTAKSTEEMKNVSTFTDLSTEGLDEAWDFVGDPYDDDGDQDIWSIDEDEIRNDGYPFFSWEELYSLTIEVEGQGSVEVYPDKVNYRADEVVTLTAIPDENWYFKDWTGDIPDNQEGYEISIVMDDHKYITAWFVKEADGVVDFEVTINEPKDGEEFEENENISIEIEVENLHHDDYEVVVPLNIHDDEDNVTANESWMVDIDGHDSLEIEHEWEAEEKGEYEITVSVHDPWLDVIYDEDAVTITVVEVYEHALKIEEPVGNGTVKVDGQEVMEWPYEKAYEYSTDVELEALPEQGWYFDGWEGTDETGEEITITMDSQKELTAYFEEHTYTLDVAIEGEGTVEVEPDLDHYEPGTDVTLTANPDEHWYFVEWSGNLNEFKENKEITVTMDEDRSITAVFEENTYTLDVTVEGEGDVEISPEKEEYKPKEEVNLTAISDEHWYFKEWIENGFRTDEDFTVTMDEDKSITAVFEENTYTLDVTVEGEGDVEISPEKEEYRPGTEVVLTAIPEENREFVRWTGNETGTNETIEITIDEDIEIKAVFEEADEDISIPGFSLIVLALGSLAALKIYSKTKK